MALPMLVNVCLLCIHDDPGGALLQSGVRVASARSRAASGGDVQEGEGKLLNILIHQFDVDASHSCLLCVDVSMLTGLLSVVFCGFWRAARAARGCRKGMKSLLGAHSRP